jgi:transcriptional regulator with XRE-family HTH domain
MAERTRWIEFERLRRDAGHSTASLGRAAGVSQNYVWQIENGDRHGGPATIKALADVFGLKPTELEATRPTRPARPTVNDTPLADVA